jgi:hypothetical protein
MLVNVFQLSKCINLDMVEEHVVIFGFNKKTQKIRHHHWSNSNVATQIRLH